MPKQWYVLSEEEFNQAYEQHSRSVFYAVMRIVNNDAVAEEILQETFLRFLQKADSGRHEEFKTFLIRISHNLAVDYVKKQVRQRNIEHSENEADRRNYESESDARVLRDTVIGRLSAMHPRYVKIFVLRVDYQMTYEEIAKTLGIPKRSMMRYIEHIKQTMQDFL
ncbi:MAG: RNA polymerase sigma factor [Leptospiraceae bacterium]|nr:RNA polymerase sigma factor [Leptospiraceae bacterium]